MPYGGVASACKGFFDATRGSAVWVLYREWLYRRKLPKILTQSRKKLIWYFSSMNNSTEQIKHKIYFGIPLPTRKIDTSWNRSSRDEGEFPEARVSMFNWYLTEVNQEYLRKKSHRAYKIDAPMCSPYVSNYVSLARNLKGLMTYTRWTFGIPV